MKIIIDGSLNGNPHLSGQDLTVLDVVSAFYYDELERLLSSHSDLDKNELIKVLEYCKHRKCDLAGGHCGGCSLRLADDGINGIADFINSFSEIRFVDSDGFIKGSGEGVMIMPGLKTEFESNWRGVNGWQLAEKILNKRGCS